MESLTWTDILLPVLAFAMALVAFVIFWFVMGFLIDHMEKKAKKGGNK